MNNTALGLIELSSISKGIVVSDTMLKTAAVELLVGRTVCSGKYISIITGDVGAVTNSIEAGKKRGAGFVIDDFIIPNIHPDILPALRGGLEIHNPEALGIVESFSVASLIEGADAAAKTSLIEIIDIRIAMALGGKAFFTITGTVAAVEAAVKKAVELISKKGLIVNYEIIPRPVKEIYYEMI